MAPGLATLSGEQTSLMLDINTGAAVLSLDYSPNGRRIVTGGQSRDVIIWDAVSGERLMTLKGHTDDVAAVRYSPNGRYVVGGAWDNTARVWDTETKQLVYTFPAHVSDTWAVAFSPDGQLIATGGGDSKVKLWDMATGILLSDLSGNAHTAEVENLMFQSEGKLLASVSRDGTLKQWRLPTTEDRVTACAATGMKQWANRGEFEKTDEYQKRMDRKDRQLDQISRECRDRIVNKFSSTVDWQVFTVGTYDADSETYKLQSKMFGDKYRLRVPPRDAERVRANFEKTSFGIPTFEIENNVVVLKRVDVTIPLDDYQKTFTIFR